MGPLRYRDVRTTVVAEAEVERGFRPWKPWLVVGAGAEALAWLRSRRLSLDKKVGSVRGEGMHAPER